MTGDDWALIRLALEIAEAQFRDDATANIAIPRTCNHFIAQADACEALRNRISEKGMAND